MKNVNWGIIGLGNIAAKFCDDLMLLPNATIHAVASRSKEKAEDFAGKYKATFAYGSYQDILECPDLDVIYIATPHHLHCENTLMCLEKGIPVLCEKPLALNAKQVNRMLAKVAEKDVFLMEALWTRFLPQTLKVMELIDAGAIGGVHSIKADFGFQAKFDSAGRVFNQALGGGSLMDVGIYPVFLALLIMGKPTEIQAVASIGETKVDENCGLLFKYDSGQLAILHSSIIANTETEAFIYGENGTIHIPSRWHGPISCINILRKDKVTEQISIANEGNGYTYEAKEVMSCLKEGKRQSLFLPHNFSLTLIKTLDEIRRKAGICYPQDD